MTDLVHAAPETEQAKLPLWIEVAVSIDQLVVVVRIAYVTVAVEANPTVKAPEEILTVVAVKVRVQSRAFMGRSKKSSILKL